MGARFQVYQLFQLFQFSAFFAQCTQEGRAPRFAESPEQTVTVSNSISHTLCTMQSVSVSQLSQYLSLCFAYLVPPKKSLVPSLIYIDIYIIY